MTNRKLSFNLLLFINIIMLAFFGFTFLQALHNTVHMDYLGQYITGFPKLLFIIGGLIILLCVLYFAVCLYNRVSDKVKLICAVILSICAVALQLTVILYMRPSLRFDALNLLDTAMLLNNGSQITTNTIEGYFSLYPYNIPACIYTLMLIKIASFIGIPVKGYMVFLQIYNCLTLDMSIFLLFILIRKYKSSSLAHGFLFLCIINPLLYYYPIFYYTQLICVPFFVGVFILFFLIWHEKNMKLKIIYTVLYGILFYIGAKIRILIGIVPIACLLWYFYHNRTLSFLKKKSLWYCGLALIFAMVLSSFIYKTMDKKYNGLPSDNQDVPYTHFVMMGFSANGSYNPDDEIFTASIDTTSERLHGTLAQIKTRLKDMGPVGIIKLFGLKLTSTWSDGYDDYADNFLLSSNYSLINDIIAGDRKDVFVAYLHWYNTFCLLLLVTAALRLMRNSDKYYFTSALILLGGMIFHLVWEAGEAYSMPFFLFLIFAASYGIPTVCRNKKFYQNKRCFLITPALALAVTAIMGICLYKPMTQVKYENTAYAALQDMPVGNAINLKNGQTLTQTFTTSRTFNRIDIGFLPSDEAKEDEACLFRLLDENNQCIYEQTIPANELNSMYNFVIPDVFPGKKQTYTLEFSGMPLNFTGYNTGNWDAYPNGVLSIDSSPCDNTDLTFIVYSVTERTLL